MLAARRLGPASFATLSIAFLLARWGALVADWGAAQNGSREAAAGDDDAVLLLARTRRTIVLALAPLYLVGVALTHHHEVWPMIAVLAAGGLTRDWFALGHGRRWAATLPSVVRGVAMLGVGIAATNLAGWSAGVGAAYAASVVVSYLTTPLPRHDAVLHPARQLRFTPPWAMILVLAAQVYTTLDTILLEVMRSAREAGTYNALYRIPLAITTVVGLAVSALLPPLTADLRAGRITVEQARRTLARVGSIGGWTVAAATPVLAVVGPLAFGPAYAKGRVALALVLLATAFATASAPLGALWLALGGERPLAFVVVAGAIANVVANVLLIPHFGMAGAGAVTMLSEGIVLAATWRWAGATATVRRPVAKGAA